MNNTHLVAILLIISAIFAYFKIAGWGWFLLFSLIVFIEKDD